jgi:hypothetical protein
MCDIYCIYIFVCVTFIVYIYLYVWHLLYIYICMCDIYCIYIFICVTFIVYIYLYVWHVPYTQMYIYNTTTLGFRCLLGDRMVWTIIWLKPRMGFIQYLIPRSYEWSCSCSWRKLMEQEPLTVTEHLPGITPVVVEFLLFNRYCLLMLCG